MKRENVTSMADLAGRDSLSEQLANLDSAPAPIGWEANVLHAIREERARAKAPASRQSRDRGGAPSGPARSWSWRHDMFMPASSFALAALVLLMVFGVREQRRNSRLADRKATIASVVEFVGLETEMAQRIAKIDQEEARKDEAFHALRIAQLESSRRPKPAERFEVRETPSRHRAKARMKPTASASCEASGDALCGL